MRRRGGAWLGARPSEGGGGVRSEWRAHERGVPAGSGVDVTEVGDSRAVCSCESRGGEGRGRHRQVGWSRGWGPVAEGEKKWREGDRWDR
jgi:hypothetical protein